MYSFSPLNLIYVNHIAGLSFPLCTVTITTITTPFLLFPAFSVKLSCSLFLFHIFSLKNMILSVPVIVFYVWNAKDNVCQVEVIIVLFHILNHFKIRGHGDISFIQQLFFLNDFLEQKASKCIV